MTRITRRNLIVGTAGIAAGASLHTSRAQTPEASPDALGFQVTAVDYTYEIPDDITAGWVSLTMTNDGKEPHHMQVAKLNDGINFETFKQGLLDDGPGFTVQNSTFSGGVGTLSAGQSCTVTLNLAEGDYAAICFLKTPDGSPHYMEGMITPFSVAAGGESAEPEADVSVSLSEWNFGMPTQLASGEHVMKVENIGGTSHEMMVMQLPQDMTVTDLLTYFGASSEVSSNEVAELAVEQNMGTLLGGMQSLVPKEYGYLHLNLEVGSYIALCLLPLPNQDSHISHADLGMIKPFIVQDPS